MNDDVLTYFCKNYPHGDPQMDRERRIVGEALVRYGITSMRELCEMTEQQIKEVRNIGAKRRAIIAEVLAQYKVANETEKIQGGNGNE